MTFLKMLLVTFMGIMISLAFATFDFSAMQYGNIINIVGIIGTIGIPISFVLWSIKQIKEN